MYDSNRNGSLQEELEEIFNGCNLDDDCDIIARKLSPYKERIRRTLDEGNHADTVSLFLRILETLADHFVKDEHYCYFDDMYSPDYVCLDMMKAILKKAEEDPFPEAEWKRLEAGMEKIAATKAWKDYGVPLALDLWKRHEREKTVGLPFRAFTVKVGKILQNAHEKYALGRIMVCAFCILGIIFLCWYCKQCNIVQTHEFDLSWDDSDSLLLSDIQIKLEYPQSGQKDFNLEMLCMIKGYRMSKRKEKYFLRDGHLLDDVVGRVKLSVKSHITDGELSNTTLLVLPPDTCGMKDKSVHLQKMILNERTYTELFFTNSGDQDFPEQMELRSSYQGDFFSRFFILSPFNLQKVY